MIPRIPRILHQIWLGDHPIPPQMEAWIAAWRTLHPGWVHKLWRGDGLTFIACGQECVRSRWPDLLQRACHLTQRSNIWRFELVYQQGGVYLDTDMEPRANIEKAIAGHTAFVASCYQPIDATSCACFGACANHPWIQDTLQSLGTKDPTVNYSMGDRFGHETFLRHVDTVHRCPCEVFLFYPNRNFAVADRLATPATLAIHRYACFWHPTGYEQLPSQPA